MLLYQGCTVTQTSKNGRKWSWPVSLFYIITYLGSWEEQRNSFKNIYEQPQNSRLQKDAMKQVSYWWSKCRLFATRVSQLRIWHFWVIGIERNVCRCTFNRYSAITQYEKLAAGEQLCRRWTHRKFSTSKPLKVSPEKSHVLSCDTVVANERYIRWPNAWGLCIPALGIVSTAFFGGNSSPEMPECVFIATGW